MLALRGRNAAILPSLSASRTSDGLDTRSARAHRANARAGPINPSADLAGRATRLGLEVIAKKPKQDFDQPGCQDGLRLTLTEFLQIDHHLSVGNTPESDGVGQKHSVPEERLD